MTYEHFDVLIVGAGLSGVGAAYRIQTECPSKSYAIIEGRPDMGGTWDLFRYPGIRSDSDMFTLGFPFEPWTEPKSIADGESILNYIKETAHKYGIDRRVRFSQRVMSASWSSDSASWTVVVERTASHSAAQETSPEEITYTCNFLYVCAGYYSYNEAYSPAFPGIEDFGGEVVAPQWWPEDLDYADKRVVVIGSGATAITLVPAMSEQTEHITMLQRSPSYIAALPATDAVADKIRDVLPERAAHSVIRVKNAAFNLGLYQFCRRAPETARKLLQSGVQREVGDAVAIDPHFTPRYDPWDQRLCMVPDGDLFAALKSGKASVVTDRIASFTADGIDLESGEYLEADIVVTATGLQMVPAGEIAISVDGDAIEPGSGVVYRGLMSSNIPNFAWCVGYTNASWTLRADLSSRFVCRFLNYLDDHGYDFGVPYISDPKMELHPILDLSSGYMQRAISILPKQGAKSPWLLRQNYFLDALSVRFGRIDRNMRFGRKRRIPTRAPVAAVELAS